MLENLIEEIGDFPYSLITDESTDLPTQKVLYIVMRFFSSVKQWEQLWQLFFNNKINACDANNMTQLEINLSVG